MIIEPGEKIHLIAKRRFERDVRRHFVGLVKTATENLIRVEGYAIVFDSARNEFIKRPEVRCRIISLTDATNIVNVLPHDVDLPALTYKVMAGNQLVITDRKSFSLDINEFGINR